MILASQIARHIAERPVVNSFTALGPRSQQRICSRVRSPPAASVQQAPGSSSTMPENAGTPPAVSAPEEGQVGENGGLPSLAEALKGRTSIKSIVEAKDEGLSNVGSSLLVAGWVRTGRQQGSGAHEPWAFLELNDGSTHANLQVMVYQSLADKHGGLKKFSPTGTSVMVRGEIKATPEGVKQRVEMKATDVLWLSTCDAGKYPLAKKQQSMEYLREIAHLRPRTQTIGCVARIRSALAYATHSFFSGQGFLHLHSPIVTASDCEGAGEMFQVTTLLSKAEEAASTPEVSEDSLVDLDTKVSQQGSAVKAAKERAKANKEDREAADQVAQELDKLMKLKEERAAAERRFAVVGGIQRLEDRRAIDYREDFFGKAAFLTVSGQLNAEYYACALTNVYTFGPTFRAENSHTARHLAEFVMIEPEMAWCDLEGDMRLAEQYVQHCCRHILDTCRVDLEFMRQRVDSTVIERLEEVANTPFKRISYTEAVDLLLKAIKEGKKFEFEVSWGVDLASEHERYLTEEVFNAPAIVYNYPKGIKAFYMRLNDDDKTVAAMDVLVPKIGELIGGSQREERLDVLERRMKEASLESEPYEAYMDMRKYGSVPHAGFGLGFERLVMFATGMDNIRDVIPFPRFPGNAKF